jgi:glucokinase
MDVAYGIDIGGTETKLAIVDRRGVVRAEGRVPTPVALGPTAAAAAAHDALRALARTQAPDLPPPCAVGVGIAGLVDHRRGRLMAAPNLDGWAGLDIGATFGAVFDCPLAFDNDAAVCALAEALVGAGRGAAFVICLTLGTGVGGGIVSGGQVLHGAHGMAGEFGHMPFVENGILCACGRRGCFEPYVNATAVVRRATEHAKRSPEMVPATWRQRLARGELEARDVGLAAAEGEPAAAAVLREVGRDLGRGIAMLVSVLDPDCVVVAGGVAQAGTPLLAPAREAAEAGILPALGSGVRIVAAGLGDRGGTLGAALLALGAVGRLDLPHVDDA